MRHVDIVGRTQEIDENGKRIVTRELDCGHKQIEPSGGEAKLALAAKCKLCEWKPMGRRLRRAIKAARR